MSGASERALHQRREEILARMRSDRQTMALLETLKARPIVPVPGEESLLRESLTGQISPSGSVETVPSPIPGETPGTETARSASAPTQRALTVGFAGRLVRADEANLNGALFTREDLNYGLASLAMAPMTYNHVGDGAVGWIEGASTSEAPDHGYHISINGRLWVGRFPFIYESFESTMAAGQASLSMECMAQAVGCLTPDCGAVAADVDGACEHILERTGPRRMISPTFYGAAVILDGVKPGWPGASLTRD